MDLEELTADAFESINAADNLDLLDQVRVNYLGKKGELTQLLKALGKLPAAERRDAGQAINQAKQAVQAQLNARRERLESAAMEAKLAAADDEAVRVDIALALPHRDAGFDQGAGGLVQLLPAGGYLAGDDGAGLRRQEGGLRLRRYLCVERGDWLRLSERSISVG